ncbi:3559_t:CDS:1, partial [Racocetra persica]
FQEFTDTTIYNETYLEILYNIVNIPYKRVYKSLNQQKKYVTANRLSKKAIQIGLDVGPSAIQELNSFMKDFITKHAPKNNQKLLRRNSKEESSRRNPKRTLSAKTYNIQSSSDESDCCESSDSNYNDNNESYSQDTENIDPLLIQNPIVYARKGAPHKTWFKGSQEIKQKNKEHQKTKEQKPTECQQCHKSGHNKAGCEK